MEKQKFLEVSNVIDLITDAVTEITCQYSFAGEGGYNLTGRRKNHVLALVTAPSTVSGKNSRFTVVFSRVSSRTVVHTPCRIWRSGSSISVQKHTHTC